MSFLARSFDAHDYITAVRYPSSQIDFEKVVRRTYGQNFGVSGEP